ncbi:MAG TPA: hypothetical protein PKU93_02695 [Candidatus Pacearchaeota archaeon]|nr:hypothetical protein [Candidatus Pacearchaeota archaeon]
MKIKHLFYVVLSCLVVGYAVYSWTEPTTMPSEYKSPINTGPTAQTKAGEIGASTFRDADNPNYYINPSGNSIISGKIIADYEVQTNDSSGTMSTKGYVDSLVNAAIMEDAPAARVYYVGDDVNGYAECPPGTTEVARKCSTNWVKQGVVCDSYNHSFGKLCVGPDPQNMLYALKHSLNDCTNAGGMVETIEENVKVCKFPYSKLAGNCRSYTESGGYVYADTCACPIGWSSYKHWSETSHISSYCAINGGGYTSLTRHTWSNVAREHCWDGETLHWATVIDYKGCY